MSSTPPRAFPPICANWAAIRISDLAGTYASSDTLERTSAALAPPETEESVPIGEQQGEQDRHGDRGPGHQRPEHRGGCIAGDDEPPRPHPVDDAREETAAEQIRQESERKGERSQQRRIGAAEDDDRQRDGRHARAGDRDELPGKDRPELARGDRGAVADPCGRFLRSRRKGRCRRPQRAIDSRFRVSSEADDAVRAPRSGRSAGGALRVLARLGDAGGGPNLHPPARALRSRARGSGSSPRGSHGSTFRRCSPSSRFRASFRTS